MDSTVFSTLLAVIDEAIEVADSAVKSAEVAQRRPEPVMLVKVAADRYQAVAAELMKTGAFREHTRSTLTRSLETASPAGMLELLEKLASKAVFPLSMDSSMDAGDLVDSPAIARINNDRPLSGTALWADCCQSSGLDVGAGYSG